MKKPLAENARLAISGILLKLSGKDFDYRQVTHENKKNIGSMSHGLYMFFVKPKGTEGIYSPAYVGYTGQPFNMRFKGHARDDKLIGRFLKEQETSTTKCKLFVSEFPCRPMIAKLLESIFLEAFDFAFNRMENGEVRDTEDLYTYNKQKDLSLEQGKKEFRKVFGKVKQDLDDIAALTY